APMSTIGATPHKPGACTQSSVAGSSKNRGAPAISTVISAGTLALLPASMQGEPDRSPRSLPAMVTNSGSASILWSMCWAPMGSTLLLASMPPCTSEYVTVRLAPAANSCDPCSAVLPHRMTLLNMGVPVAQIAPPYPGAYWFGAPVPSAALLANVQFVIIGKLVEV